jgi:hypothetical protein
MAFIHKNINSGLLMLITFISVALVTATVYSVQAFDSLNEAYAEKAMLADTLSAELAAKDVMTDTLKQTAQLTQEREAALAQIIAQKQQETAQPQVESAAQVSVTNAKASYPGVNKAPYNPYRQKYFGWVPQKKYVV